MSWSSKMRRYNGIRLCPDAASCRNSSAWEYCFARFAFSAAAVGGAGTKAGPSAMTADGEVAPRPPLRRPPRCRRPVGGSLRTATRPTSDGQKQIRALAEGTGSYDGWPQRTAHQCGQSPRRSVARALPFCARVDVLHNPLPSAEDGILGEGWGSGGARCAARRGDARAARVGARRRRLRARAHAGHVCGVLPPASSSERRVKRSERSGDARRNLGSSWGEQGLSDSILLLRPRPRSKRFTKQLQCMAK